MWVFNMHSVRDQLVVQCFVVNYYCDILMYNTSMVSFDGGSASKVDDVTA